LVRGGCLWQNQLNAKLGEALLLPISSRIDKNLHEADFSFYSREFVQISVPHFAELEVAGVSLRTA